MRCYWNNPDPISMICALVDCGPMRNCASANKQDPWVAGCRNDKSTIFLLEGTPNNLDASCQDFLVHLDAVRLPWEHAALPAGSASTDDGLVYCVRNPFIYISFTFTSFHF
jgi:hypothetical protein